MTRPQGQSSGFSAVASSSLVAGLLGYAITIAAARLLGVDYGAFGIFWSALYFAVGALSGAQHELARMTRHVAEAAPGNALSGVISWFFPASLGLAILCSALAATTVLENGSIAQPLALGLGLASYGIYAILLGTQYGARRWRVVAVVTILDPLLRLVLILTIYGLGGGVEGAMWAAVVPFPVLAAALFSIVRRDRSLRIDLPPHKALLAAGGVVLAGVASSFIINGVPLLFELVSDDSEPETIARYVFAFILIRAPLVVGALALQSFLVVTLRDHLRSGRLVVLLAGCVAMAVAIGSVVVLAAGREAIEFIAPTTGAPGDGILVGILIASGTTAVMVITGCLALAWELRVAYALGWWVAAFTIVLLAIAVPGDAETRVTLASILGPLAGIAVNLGFAIRHRRTH